MKNSEYLFLAGAAGFSILPSILRRTGVSPTGIRPAGAAITLPDLPIGHSYQGFVDWTYTNPSITLQNFLIELQANLGGVWMMLANSKQDAYAKIPGTYRTNLYTYQTVGNSPTDTTFPPGTYQAQVIIKDPVTQKLFDTSLGSFKLYQSSIASAQITNVTVAVV